MALSDAERAKKYRDGRRSDRDGVTAETVTDRDENVTTVTPTEPRDGESVTSTVTEPALEFDRFGVAIRPRICLHCHGLTFDNLIAHADHLQTHNPTPEQWAIAYERMQAAKSKAGRQAAD